MVLIDYGSEHMPRVCQALEQLKVNYRVSAHPQTILEGNGVILPGGSAFGEVMRELRRNRLDEVIWEVSLHGTPLLGIGLGMQLLFTESEEQGLHRGINLLPGTVRRLTQEVKVPHNGWREIRFLEPHGLFSGLTEGRVYFDHSYHVEVANREELLATVHYGGTLAAIAGRGRVIGMQFHPEQSGSLGRKLLKNFTSICQKESV